MTAAAIDPRSPEATTDVLKALAHDLRLKLVQTLAQSGEKSVGELEVLTGIGQPGLSQQLALLRKAGLVRSRRESKLVFYSLNQQVIAALAGLLADLAGSVGAASPSSPSPKPRTLPRAGSAAAFAKLI